MKNQRKIKVLGIAPYEGMRTLMESLADHHPAIDLDVFVGDLSLGAEIARRNTPNDYDVIISRGGTAEMIEKVTSLPVIEISISAYDVLQAIQLAKNFNGRYAIIGFSSITRPARMLCSLLRYQVEIITLHDASEVSGAVSRARSLGCEIVLCDTVTEGEARKMDMNTVLITSGREAIEAALDDAEKVSRNYLSVLEDGIFYRKLLEEQENETVVFDADGTLRFSTIRTAEGERLLRMLRDELPTSRQRKERKLFKTVGDRMYSVTSLHLSMSGQDHVVFTLNAMDMPIQAGRYGIKYYNRQESDGLFFNNLFSMSRTAREIQTSIDQINQSHFAVMILGEPGTGRAQCANLMYRRSRLSDNPLVAVDCSLLSEKGWRFLTNHYDSPLNDNGNTIHFQKLTALGPEKMKQLQTTLSDIDLCARNRVIFSAALRDGEAMLPLLREFMNTFSCITIRLPALREHIDELPSIASFYISSLNVSLAKKIVGFDDEAMALLQAYDWPENYTQLRRVINELVLSAETPVVPAEMVRNVLSREDRIFSRMQRAGGKDTSPENRTAGVSPTLTLRLDQPLDQINLEVAQAVLADCGGNQSLAARRLGIGRTTLWRMLRMADQKKGTSDSR